MFLLPDAGKLSLELQLLGPGDVGLFQLGSGEDGGLCIRLEAELGAVGQSVEELVLGEVVLGE